MKNRPRSLVLLSGVLLAIAASFPAQIMLLHGHSPLEAGEILAQLAPFNWAVIAVSLVFAVLAFRASRATIYAAPLFVAVTSWNNWLVCELQPGASLAGTGAASLLAALAAFGPLAVPSVRRVLRNPRLRWWRTPSRKRVALTAKVRPVKGGEVSAVTFDLSESGAFIATEHASWDRLRQGSHALEVGAHCSLKLDLDSYRALHCIAKVIRHTEARGNYPGGFALHFEGLSTEDRRVLGRFLS